MSIKFSVGYNINHSDELVDFIVKNKNHIYEMYFSFFDFPNGRNTLQNDNPYETHFYYQKQIEHLKILSDNNISLNLLLNGNCYGKDSLSRAFFNKIGNTVDYLKEEFNLSSVTTTSPVIAKFIKENFDDVKTRASVNMEIGTIEGMEYIANVFDGYYLKREFNRDFEKIKTAKKWCDENNKQLFMLANSGCLNNCSAHNFHDNLVAHEVEISKMDNAYLFEGICHSFLKEDKNKYSIIARTSFIRPEDLHVFDGYFESFKIATRVNKNPVNVLKAYINKSYRGAVTDILEPSHSDILYPYVIENKNIDENFLNTVLNCKKNCHECNYCKKIYENSLVKLEGGVFEC